MFPDFLVDHNTIHKRINAVNPAGYASSRNYLKGTVTYLSPFITHGVIDTCTVADVIVENFNHNAAEKLLTELAWREFFHRTWQQHGDNIFSDMRHPQEQVISDQIPEAICTATTDINVIDDCLSALSKHSYMHNHARMWVAAITCNVGRTHWYQPARWLYYHLLDGDLASNSLSWQWVAGSFSHRKYYANQENINRYSEQHQVATFLDTSYEDLATITIPDVLQKRVDADFENIFPVSTAGAVQANESKILLHSIWNLDPTWRSEDTGRRVLWIEPSQHREFALSPKRWQFIEHWARQIEGLEIFVGEEAQLFPHGTDNIQIHHREYPATKHWPTGREGNVDARRWCYPEPEGAISSFSKYWKPIRKTSKFFT